jgi:hypothetical protein
MSTVSAYNIYFGDDAPCKSRYYYTTNTSIAKMDPDFLAHWYLNIFGELNNDDQGKIRQSIVFQQILSDG